jgi:uncharacterized protein (TIGR02246 family)
MKKSSRKWSGGLAFRKALRAVAALAGTVLVGSAAAAQSVERQITSEVAQFVAAVNSGDARKVAALYLDDSRTSSVGDGGITRGWQRVSDLIQESFGRAGRIRMATDSITVLPLGDKAAVAVLRYRWMIGRENDRRVAGAMTLVYTRTRRGWRVAHDHTSTLETVGSVAGETSAAPSDSGPTAPRRQTSTCTITRIVDGDTIECAKTGHVRLIGMDTPEAHQRPFGAQASAALAGLIPVGIDVQLELDVGARDRSGRLLAYVWVRNTMINWRMVRDGWAVLLTYPPNVQYVDWFTEAERRARDEKRGLWATGGFDCRPVDRRARRCD